MSKLISDLFQAAEEGNSVVVEEMLKVDPSLVNAENEHGLTLLGISAHYGNYDVVKVLFSYGVDINAISHSKLSFIPRNTALHAAIAGKKSIEIIKLLLEKGADCNILDSEGHTPLHTTAFEGNTEIAKLLLNHGARIIEGHSLKTSVEIAEERGNKDFIAILKEYSLS